MPRYLDAEQQRLLDAVGAAHAAKVRAIGEARRDADRLIRERTEAATLVESRAVRVALDGGVPATRVGRDGLLTTDYRTVQKVLEVTAAEHAAEEAVMETFSHPRVRPASEAERTGHGYGERDIIRIDWTGFVATTANLRRFWGDLTNLHGFVERSNRRGRATFRVVQDDSEDPARPEQMGSLTLALDEDELLTFLRRVPA